MTEEGPRTCFWCKHAWIEDTDNWTSDFTLSWNVEIGCPTSNKGEFVGCYIGRAFTEHTCKRFERAAVPIKVWPYRPKKMRQAGIWYTDSKAEPKRPEPQRTLDSWGI
ncbi:MAG: hypothetical protein Q4Q62_05305 [Thermoplasmata archaeon]|nr:hypothetical protein [Thermoplasmata archaeon]